MIGQSGAEGVGEPYTVMTTWATADGSLATILHAGRSDVRVWKRHVEALFVMAFRLNPIKAACASAMGPFPRKIYKNTVIIKSSY